MSGKGNFVREKRIKNEQIIVVCSFFIAVLVSSCYGVFNEKNISYEEGHQQGLRDGIAATVSICRDMNMEEAQIRKNLVEKFSLSEEEAEQCLKDLFVRKV